MKRSRLKRRSKQGNILSELDALLRQYLLLKYQVCCACGNKATAGRGHGLESAHILPKGQWPNLRYHLSNTRLLCHRCHHHRAHKDPFFWVNLIGAEEMLKLRNLALLVSKPDRKLEKIMLRQAITNYMSTQE